MIGAIIGDIIGSRFEFNNTNSKEFELFVPECSFTDDSVMSLAVAEAIINSNGNYELQPKKTIESMLRLGRLYPHAGYGSRFKQWLNDDSNEPYNSFGNGAAMRVSACGFAARSLEEAKHLSYNATYVTHNHYEGIKGAEATAVSVFLAKTGCNKNVIKDFIDRYYYHMNFSIDEIRDDYYFDVSCQGTVPQALEAFFEAENFEDAIRIAISIGGDSDTLAAITGAVAEAYYGVPLSLRDRAISFLDPELQMILKKFETVFEN